MENDLLEVVYGIGQLCTWKNRPLEAMVKLLEERGLEVKKMSTGDFLLLIDEAAASGPPGGGA